MKTTMKILIHMVPILTHASPKIWTNTVLRYPRNDRGATLVLSSDNSHPKIIFPFTNLSFRFHEVHLVHRLPPYWVPTPQLFRSANFLPRDRVNFVCELSIVPNKIYTYYVNLITNLYRNHSGLHSVAKKRSTFVHLVKYKPERAIFYSFMDKRNTKKFSKLLCVLETNLITYLPSWLSRNISRKINSSLVLTHFLPQTRAKQI